MKQAVRGEGECPSCRSPVGRDWIVCADCGATLGPGSRGGASKARESMLPSTDSGYTAFVPVVGGARRPITVMEAEVSPPETPWVAARSPLVETRHEVSVPPMPRPEEPRRPVTVVGVTPETAGRGAEEEEALSVSLPAEAPAAEAKQAAPENAVSAVGAATASDLRLALIALSRDRSLSLRVAREDLDQIQGMVDEAVRRALFELAGFPLKDAGLASPAAQTQVAQRQRGRLAGAGVGLLLGGAAAGVVALNWDIWIRGELVSSVGWLQQLGIIGMAGLAGAGAAAALIAVAWGRRRSRRVRLTVTRTRSWGAPPAANRAR